MITKDFSFGSVDMVDCFSTRETVAIDDTMVDIARSPGVETVAGTGVGSLKKNNFVDLSLGDYMDEIDRLLELMYFSSSWM